MTVFPDSLDEGANQEIGYMPGKLKWLLADKLEKLGVKIVNTGITGEVCKDRNVLTGDSPLAANNLGILTADELLARYHGWTVQTDETLHVKHLRPTGAGYKSNARYLQGSVFYRMRYGVLLTLLAAVKLAVKKRSGKLFLDYCKGFYKAKQEKQPYLLSAEEGKWVRQYRWKGIFSKFYNR